MTNEGIKSGKRKVSLTNGVEKIGQLNAKV